MRRPIATAAARSAPLPPPYPEAAAAWLLVVLRSIARCACLTMFVPAERRAAFLEQTSPLIAHIAWRG